MSAPDPIAAFTDTMRQRGIVVPKQIIADGLLHRCDVEGGKASKDDAAYVLHLDGVAAGGCINWKDGQGWENWSAKPEASMSEYERRKLRSEIERQRRLRDEEEKQRRADAVERAKRTLSSAPTAAVEVDGLFDACDYSTIITRADSMSSNWPMVRASSPCRART